MPNNRLDHHRKADHRRVRKQTPVETKSYLYDFEKVLRESDGDGDTVRDFTATDGQYGSLVSEFEAGSGETLYHEYDAIGSTTGLTTDTGLVSDRYQYRAFGLESHQSVLTGRNGLQLRGSGCLRQ